MIKFASVGIGDGSDDVGSHLKTPPGHRRKKKHMHYYRWKPSAAIKLLERRSRKAGTLCQVLTFAAHGGGALNKVPEVIKLAQMGRPLCGE